MDPHVVHNSELSRYELFLGDQKIGHADYRKVDGVLEFPHTEVDPAHQGKNYAAILMRESFRDVEENDLGKVWPICPYVVTYMKRHPETHDLLAKPLA
jgi:predicted GNAT family acetyltransferase